MLFFLYLEPDDEAGLWLTSAGPGASALFLVLSVGLLCARPDRGNMALATSRTTGGLIVRRLMPVALLLVPFGFWLRLEAERSGLYGPDYGVALMALANVILLGGVAWFGALYLDRLDARRRRAEASQQMSETRFEATFEQAAVGIALVAPDGNWLRVNEKLASILGYSTGEMSALTFRDITHADDIDADAALVRRMLAREITSYSIETRLLHKDKRCVWVTLTVALALRDDGEPDYFIFVIEDVTAAKAARQEVLVTKAKMEAALASMTDAVFISDAAGHFLEFNDAFATFHKYRDKAECARTVGEYFAILDVQSMQGKSLPPEQWPVPRALRGGSATNAEFILHRRDTGDRWVGSFSFGPIRDEQGAIVGAVVAARDVTESKNAEAQAHLNEMRYRALVDQSADALFVHDHSGRLLEVSQRACDSVGYSRDELLAMNIVDLEQDSGLAEAQAVWARIEPGNRDHAAGSPSSQEWQPLPRGSPVRRHRAWQ